MHLWWNGLPHSSLLYLIPLLQNGFFNLGCDGLSYSPKIQGFLSPQESLKLFQKLLGKQDKRIAQEPKVATAILELLGNLPLAIVLVGGYLVADLELLLSVMLERLQEEKLAAESLQNRETINSTQLGVQAAFNLTWKRLTPQTQQLGKFLSLFSPHSIAWKLVVRTATKKDVKTVRQGDKKISRCGDGLDLVKEELHEGRKELYKHNLLKRVKNVPGYYQVHSLVRWFLQSKFKESGEMGLILAKIFAVAMVAEAQSIPELLTHNDIKLHQDKIPHLEELARRLIEAIKEKSPEDIHAPASVPKDKVTWIFSGIGRFYEEQGLYKLAEPWYEQCLQVCQVLFTESHPNIARSIDKLAKIYYSQGRYTKAKPLFLQALEIKNRFMGSEHCSFANSLTDLGLLKTGV